jgi:hypothetical protein
LQIEAKWEGDRTRDLEHDLIYVNGDNNLENLRRTIKLERCG